MRNDNMGATLSGATPAAKPEWHDVDFSGFLAFKPPKRVRDDVRQMIFDGAWMDEIHPETFRFLRRHRLSVTLEGPRR